MHLEVHPDGRKYEQEAAGWDAREGNNWNRSQANIQEESGFRKKTKRLLIQKHRVG